MIDEKVNAALSLDRANNKGAFLVENFKNVFSRSKDVSIKIKWAGSTSWENSINVLESYEKNCKRTDSYC